MAPKCNPVLVSFSGIDGAGKSTQIERLSSRLAEAGTSVLQLAFWDNVVFLSCLRAGVSHKVLRGEVGIGAPGKPVKRKDKNAQRWYLTLPRSAFYLLDALSLRRVVAKARKSGADVIIFDRYIYDQLANVPQKPWIGRAYIRLLLRLAPRPNIAYLLDAEPAAALARKPEYPVDFLHNYRRAYFGLSALAAEMVVIPPSEPEGVERIVLQQFQKLYPLEKHSTNGTTITKPQHISA